MHLVVGLEGEARPLVFVHGTQCSQRSSYMSVEKGCPHRSGPRDGHCVCQVDVVEASHLGPSNDAFVARPVVSCVLESGSESDVRVEESVLIESVKSCFRRWRMDASSSKFK